MVVFGVVLALLFDFGPADMSFPLLLVLVPLAGLCPDVGLGFLPVPLLWALHLSLMALSLRYVRKTRTKSTRILGHIAVFMVFALAYAIGWYFAVEAIGSALAAAAFMSFM